MESSNFTHLHLHTDNSLLDSIISIPDAVKKTKSMGMTALAITDHGNCCGFPEFYDECKKSGIKPILGCEVYEAPNSRFEKKTDELDNVYYHLILLVKNKIGYKNLCILVSRSNTEGFYYKPRIDFELLKKHHEGLICLSACVAGRIPQLIINNKNKEAEETALKYKNLFGDDFYLEIQNHGLEKERIAEEEIVKIARRNNIKLVATNDCHYLNSEDSKAHEWFLCIQTKKTIHDKNRLIYQGDYSIKSEEEMRELFPSFPDAIENTMEIVNKCNFEFDFGNYRMPVVHIPEKYNNDYFQYLKDIAYQGLEERYPNNHPEKEDAKKRLEYELSVIKQMGFAEYFLDTRKTVMYAKTHNILVGPGRGCVNAGTLIYTNLGLKPIENIQVGEYVYTHFGTLKKVLKTHKYPVNKNETLIRPNVYFGDEYGNAYTANHKLWAVKAKYNKAGKLIKSKARPSWIKAKDLEVNDLIVFPKIESKITGINETIKNPYEFGRTLSEETIPEIVQTFSIEEKQQFWNGLCNNIYLTHGIWWYSFSTDDFLYKLKKFLGEINVPNGITYKEDIYREVITFPASNKISEAMQWCEFRDNMVLKRIYSIDNIEAKYVYDITVEDNHSYLTTNYAAHNSGAGSILNYCLKITDIDPLKYGLLFERFLNPSRVSMPKQYWAFNVNLITQGCF